MKSQKGMKVSSPATGGTLLDERRREEEEVMTKFQVKRMKKRQGQGTIYLALKLRKELDWKQGDILSVKINKTEDGVEIRRVGIKNPCSSL